MERSLVVIDTKPSHSRGVLSAFTLLLRRIRKARIALGARILFKGGLQIGRAPLMLNLRFNGVTTMLLGSTWLTQIRETSLMLSTSSTGWIGTRNNFHAPNQRRLMLHNSLLDSWTLTLWSRRRETLFMKTRPGTTVYSGMICSR